MLLAASRARADVRLPPGHPLSRFVQRISASEAATEIRQAAHAELDRAARAPSGFLLPPVLSCGCRKWADGQRHVRPAETARPRRRRQRDRSTARQLLGRSLVRLPHPDGTGEQAYAFAHDTLLTEARSRFASDLPTYENLI